jgi:hypothetical protein
MYAYPKDTTSKAPALPNPIYSSRLVQFSIVDDFGAHTLDESTSMVNESANEASRPNDEFGLKALAVFSYISWSTSSWASQNLKISTLQTKHLCAFSNAQLAR